MFGFLNVYKPKGKTSHDVVAMLRRITGVRRIGHTGTLDPLAEGVLPICIGKATRLIEYLNDDKAYTGIIQFGSSTTTYDAEGEITNSSDKIPTLEEIESALKSFYGEINQLPPAYSAIKINGKKLYEYARSGQEIDITPRTVYISKLEILNYNIQNKQLELKIECSKGTYIRSIANDLGENIGCFGHLTKLIRIKAGDFRIENSIKLEDLQTKESIENHLINPVNYLDYQKYELNQDEMTLISNGRTLKTNLKDGIAILISDNNVIATGNVKDKIYKPSKVFI